MLRRATHLPPSAPITIGDQFFRYVAVGACGTGLHYLAMFGLVAALAVDPVPASTGGAILGALTNYGLNHRFTFRSRERHSAAMPRFLLVAAIGLGLNALLLGLLLHLLDWPTPPAQLAATAGVLVFTFLANRILTF